MNKNICIFLLMIVELILFLQHPDLSHSQNLREKDCIFNLDFSKRGTIFGSLFEIKITGNTFSFQETAFGKEIKKFERSLLPEELVEIQNTITQSNLIDLASQDFTREPPLPDQPSYHIVVTLDRIENTVDCSVPPSGTEPVTDCQKQINKLRLKLNKILGVNIK